MRELYFLVGFGGVYVPLSASRIPGLTFNLALSRSYANLPSGV
jgi:hypothetical protein